MILEKGKIVMFSEGEYSDYQIMGTYHTLQAFDIKDVLAGYKKETEDEQKDGFIAYMLRRRLIEEFDTVEVHLGSYGELEIE